jgi:hypothetical protein
MPRRKRLLDHVIVQSVVGPRRPARAAEGVDSASVRTPKGETSPTASRSARPGEPLASGRAGSRFSFAPARSRLVQGSHKNLAHRGRRGGGMARLVAQPKEVVAACARWDSGAGRPRPFGDTVVARPTAVVTRILSLNEISNVCGWGTWIRTKIDGVRVRCSTVELSPNGRLKRGSSRGAQGCVNSEAKAAAQAPSASLGAHCLRAPARL